MTGTINGQHELINLLLGRHMQFSNVPVESMIQQLNLTSTLNFTLSLLLMSGI